MKVSRIVYLILFLFLNLVSVQAQIKESSIDEKSAKAALKSGNLKEAIDQFNFLLHLHPKNYEYHALIGFAYLNSHFDYNQAVEHLKKATMGPKVDPYIYYDLGSAYMLCY